MGNIKTQFEDSFINRVEILRKAIKDKGFDTESILALNRANRSGYKTKGKLPSFTTLESLACDFDVNLNWLVLGRGEIFYDAPNPEGIIHKRCLGDNTGIETLRMQNDQLKQEMIDTLKEMVTMYKRISELEEKIKILTCCSKNSDTT